MRYIGLILLFLVPCIIGISAGNGIRLGEKVCEGFIDMLEYIRDKIILFRCPVKEIYRGYNNSALEKTGFLESLRLHERDDIYIDAWKRAFEECNEEIPISDEEREIILAFGECVGKYDIQAQKDAFDYYIALLRELNTKKKAENAKNIKMYRVIGITAGAALLLIAL